MQKIYSNLVQFFGEMKYTVCKKKLFKQPPKAPSILLNQLKLDGTFKPKCVQDYPQRSDKSVAAKIPW